MAVGDTTQEYTKACEEIASAIYHSYVANELICLYAEISLWEPGISVDIFKSFKAYTASIIPTTYPQFDGAQEVALFHSKMDVIGMKVVEVGQVRQK